MRRTARLRAVGFVALVALTACGDDAGPSGADAAIEAGSGPVTLDAASASGRDAAISCGDFGQSEACTACIADACCTAGAACEASAECSLLVACARACDAGDSDCLVACVADHPTGRGGYNTLVLCMGDRCLDDCPHPTP